MLSMLKVVVELLLCSISFPTELYIIRSRERTSDKKCITAPTFSGIQCIKEIEEFPWE